MGICEICNPNPSFRCTYEVKDYNPIQIINNGDENDFHNMNRDIEAKIKILNGNKKEQITLTKKFNQIGLNVIEFIIEEQLTNMSYMFNNCSFLKKIEFISIDTSKVTDLTGIFQGCKELEYLDLTKFNTSNVNDIKCMFNGCNKLKEIKGINYLNTSNVKDMTGMFNDCKELEYLDLSNFDTYNVTNMNFMFNN